MEIQSVNSARDLGIIVSQDLKFHEHCAKIVRSTSIMSNLIFRSFPCRQPGFLVRMFWTFVQPHLEYATQVWTPHLKKDIDLVESIQRRYTKRIPGLQTASYPDGLACLNLDSLEYQRIYFDLVMVYKLLYGLVDCDYSQFFPCQPT